MSVTLPGGVVLNVMGPTEHVSRYVTVKRQWYEADLLTAIQRRNIEGPYLDVGGHIGNHAVWFSTQCKATEVVSIEPWEPARRVLESNLKANAKVPWSVLPYVIGVESAKVIHEEHLRGPHRQPLWLTRAAKPEDNIEDILVCHSLDALVMEGRIPSNIALVKLDVDWWEGPVLQGAIDTFQTAKPIIALEVAEGDRVFNRLMQCPALKGYRRIGKYCSTPTYLLEHCNA
tara:strand:+ start:2284 stop:2973 length:690 start_codon:yes stop_codon:yes gene_type:complete